MVGTHSYMISVRHLALVVAMLAPSVAAAEPCRATAIISGDPALVDSLSHALTDRGISTAESPSCPAVRIEVASRGTAIIVTRLGAAASNTRIVSQLETAASVVESWTRTDLDSPVLEPSIPFVLEHRDPHADAVGELRPAAATVQVFSSFETSVADDRTGWLGVAAGVCIQVRTLCASARGRVAAVIEGGPMWRNVERHGEDLIFGGDVPHQLGVTRVTFGFGGGMGATHTGIEGPSGMHGSETFGLRADAHIAWIVPLAHNVALDLSASIDIAQVTDVETSSMPRLADEPRAFGRFGAGIRVGGL